MISLDCKIKYASALATKEEQQKYSDLIDVQNRLVGNVEIARQALVFAKSKLDESGIEISIRSHRDSLLRKYPLE